MLDFITFQLPQIQGGSWRGSEHSSRPPCFQDGRIWTETVQWELQWWTQRLESPSRQCFKPSWEHRLDASNCPQSILFQPLKFPKALSVHSLKTFYLSSRLCVVPQKLRCWTVFKFTENHLSSILYLWQSCDIYYGTFIVMFALKAVYTIGNCQRLAYTVGVSQHMH